MYTQLRDGSIAVIGTLPTEEQMQELYERGEISADQFVTVIPRDKLFARVKPKVKKIDTNEEEE